MRETISNDGTASINASSTDKVWLAMAHLTHVYWEDPVCIVANTESVTHDSETYLPFPFDVSLPDEDAESTSVVSWVAANASNELLSKFRDVSGPIQGRIFWVLSTTPEHIELGPFDLELRGFEYDATTIKGSLVVEPVLDAVFGSKSMDAGNAPGLF